MKEVLVTWGSKYGGTEGIARMLGESLEARGKTVVTLMPAAEVYDLHRFDAVIIGGALYGNRWHKDARRFVTRHVRALRRVPVWSALVTTQTMRSSATSCASDATSSAWARVSA